VIKFYDTLNKKYNFYHLLLDMLSFS